MGDEQVKILNTIIVNILLFCYNLKKQNLKYEYKYENK